MRPSDRLLLWLVFSAALANVVNAGVPHYRPTPAAQVAERGAYSPASLSEVRDSVVAREARRQGIDPAIAIAVSHVENWSGDPTAVSSAGAVGVMQVMPLWAGHGPLLRECGGGWAEPPLDLYDMNVNACAGVWVLKQYHERHGDWDTALRAYNGALRHPNAGLAYVRHVVRRLERM